jgi:hypothetical protein
MWLYWVMMYHQAIKVLVVQISYQSGNYITDYLWIYNIYTTLNK